MRTIWKYAVDDGPVSMPSGARILSVQVQRGDLTLWAEVDSDAPAEIRRFRVYGTGHELPRGLGYQDSHIATVQDEPFVWHVYEEHGYGPVPLPSPPRQG